MCFEKFLVGRSFRCPSGSLWRAQHVCFSIFLPPDTANVEWVDLAKLVPVQMSSSASGNFALHFLHLWPADHQLWTRPSWPRYFYCSRSFWTEIKGSCRFPFFYDCALGFTLEQFSLACYEVLMRGIILSFKCDRSVKLSSWDVCAAKHVTYWKPTQSFTCSTSKTLPKIAAMLCSTAEI